MTSLLLALVLLGALPVPPLTGQVMDRAGVLDPTERARIERSLQEYAQRTGHQFAVLIVPSLAGDSMEDFSMRVAEAWRLGDAKRDDGLLMVLAVQDRLVRIEVGYGLEGAVTDALAGRVIREDLAPRLAQGRYAEAIEAAMARLMSAASGEAVGTTRGDDGNEAPFAGFILVLLLMMSALMTWLPRSARTLVGGATGGAMGMFMFGNPVPALLFMFVGAIIMGSGLGPVFLHSWSRGRGGGFSGGGGRFGGGGSTGRW